MSLAVTIGLGARSRQSDWLRGASWLIVLAGGCLAAVAVWQGFADAPPAGTPAADHHAPWRALAVVLACAAACIVLSWRRFGVMRRAIGMPARDLDHGWLVIDEAGAAGWRSHPTAGVTPLSLHDCYLGRTLMSLRFAPAGSRLGAPTAFDTAARSGEPSASCTAASPAFGTAASPAPADSRPLHLLLARDAVSADQWRRLRVWVLWRQRGGRDGLVL